MKVVFCAGKYDSEISLVHDGEFTNHDEQSIIATKLAEALMKAEKLDKERSQALEELHQEKVFWRLRQKAHGLGLSDEDLRTQIKAAYWFNLDKFEPKPK